MKQFTVRYALVESSILIRRHWFVYLLLSATLTFILSKISDQLFSFVAPFLSNHNQYEPALELATTFLLHLVIVKAAVVHFTNKAMLCQRVRLRDWRRSLDLEGTARSILRILSIYTMVALILLPVFLVLFGVGYKIAWTIENPSPRDFIPTPSDLSLAIVVLSSTTLLLPVVARYWLAVPNAILDGDGLVASFKNSGRKVKGHTGTIFLLLCSFLLPCMTISLVVLEWVAPGTIIAVVIVGLVISFASLLDAVALTVSHHKLSRCASEVRVLNKNSD